MEDQLARFEGARVSKDQIPSPNSCFLSMKGQSRNVHQPPYLMDCQSEQRDGASIFWSPGSSRSRDEASVGLRKTYWLYESVGQLRPAVDSSVCKSLRRTQFALEPAPTRGGVVMRWARPGREVALPGPVKRLC